MLALLPNVYSTLIRCLYLIPSSKAKGVVPCTSCAVMARLPSHGCFATAPYRYQEHHCRRSGSLPHSISRCRPSMVLQLRQPRLNLLLHIRSLATPDLARRLVGALRIYRSLIVLRYANSTALGRSGCGQDSPVQLESFQNRNRRGPYRGPDQHSTKH